MEDADDSDESTQFLDVSKKRPSVQESPPAPPATSRCGSRSSTASGWRPSLLQITSAELTCPTCRGEGRLPRSRSHELMALIPYSDKRLKPRRRWCVYVSISLVLVLVCGGVLLGFMFPRTASLSLLSLNSSTDWIPVDNQSAVIILMDTRIRIKNDNFFSLHVDWLNVSLYNVNTRVGDKQARSLSVGARQDTMAAVSQNATFSDDLGQRVRTICTGEGWEHCLAMVAVVEMKYTVLSHSAETLTSRNFFVECDFIESDPGMLSCS